jgi:hypothetical protein
MNTTATKTNKSTIPTIIGIADSTHYLVGRVDSGNNFIGLESTQQNEVFSSITEAKKLFTSSKYFLCSVRVSNSIR